MSVVQKGDFIKISYTAKLQNGVVFDTTDASVAKEHGIYNEKASYGPETIVVGKGYVVPGLDEDLIGKDVGYKGDITLPPEKGFGLKRLDQIETIPAKKFKEKLHPGQRVSVQGRTGTVESTQGGRVRINFNPMFAGETLSYTYSIDELIEGKDNKIKAITKMYTGRDFVYTEDDGKIIIDTPMEMAYSQNWPLIKSVIASQINELEGVNAVVFQETFKKEVPAAEEKAEEAPAEKTE